MLMFNYFKSNEDSKMQGKLTKKMGTHEFLARNFLVQWFLLFSQLYTRKLNL